MSIQSNAQILQPGLNSLYSAAPASGDASLGDHLVSMAKAQPGLGNPAVAIPNLASGGAIGAAPATVDNASAFLVNQTTAGQALSLPSPSDPSVVRTAHVVNVGSQAFTVGGVSHAPGAAVQHLWHGTAWVPVA